MARDPEEAAQMKAQAIQEVTFDFAKLNQKDPVAKTRLSRKSIDQRRVSTIHETQTATLEAAEGAGDGEVADNATFEYYVENVLPQVQSLRFPDTTDDMLEDLQAKIQEMAARYTSSSKGPCFPFQPVFDMGADR
ncbi:hypothetical protein N0V85_009932, partial [Neurospora sp. IMI 360204]